MTHVSRQNSEDDADSVAPLSADDLGLETLGELGASVLLIRNVATEVVSTAEHVRSAATSVWNALSHLSNSDGSQVASTGTGSGLAAVTDALGDVLGAARGRSSARGKEQSTGDS